MKKQNIILILATATGLYLVIRGLKKNAPADKDEAVKSSGSAYKGFIGSDGQGKYFNAHGGMSLDNLVRSYKRP